MGRYLIVANQTLGGDELEDRIQDRIEGGHGKFHVLVPMVEPDREAQAWIPPDPAFGIASSTDVSDEAVERTRKRSRHRLDRMIAKIRAMGGEAKGEIGESDPLAAVKRVLQRESFDEVIVSTLPAGISRWLKMDLPSRVSRAAPVPVTTVEAGG